MAFHLISHGSYSRVGEYGLVLIPYLTFQDGLCSDLLVEDKHGLNFAGLIAEMCVFHEISLWNE